MKIKMNHMAIIISVVIFGGIGLTMATGFWTTTSEKIPVTYSEGEYAGTYNPDDIRGSYTFEEISNLFEIDIQVLFQAFGLPEDTNGTEFKSKNLEDIYKDAENEIGNGSVQLFVALYKNLPIEFDGTYLPESAAEIILSKNKNLTQEQIEYLKSYQVKMDSAITDSDNTIASSDNGAADSNSTVTGSDSTITGESTSVESAEENLIRGTTTFQQALDAGITREQLEQIIDAPLPPANQTIKDYCNQSGLSFSEVKDNLNGLLQ